MAQGGAKFKTIYNRGHIAVGTTGTNFLWRLPWKSSRSQCEKRLGAERREEVRRRLEEKDLERGSRGKRNISLILTENEFKKSKQVILESINLAEAYSVK